MLFRRQCASTPASPLLRSCRRHTALAHSASAPVSATVAAVEGADAVGDLRPAHLASSSLSAQLASLSAHRQQVLGRDVQLFALAALRAVPTAPADICLHAPPKALSRREDGAEPQQRRTEQAHRAVPLPDRSQRAPAVQYALARQFAATGPWTGPDAAPVTSDASAQPEALERLFARLARTTHALMSAEDAVWSALSTRAEVAQSSSSPSAPIAPDDGLELGDDDDTFTLRGNVAARVRRLRQMLRVRNTDTCAHLAITSSSAAVSPSMPPLRLCALVSWCGEQVCACAAEIRAAASAMAEDQTLASESGETEDVTLRGCDAQAAAALFSAAHETCALLETYLALVVDGLFVQGGFGEEGAAAEATTASGAEETQTVMSAIPTRRLPASASPLAALSQWSRRQRAEARATCVSVLEMLEALEARLLPAWLAAASTAPTTTTTTATEDGTVWLDQSPRRRGRLDDPQRVLHGLRLEDHTVQLALCSQREHWPSVLALTARLCRWNARLLRHTSSSRTGTGGEEEEEEADVNACALVDAEAEVPLGTAQQLAQSLPQDTALSIAYVLAQHGELALTEVFLHALSSTRTSSSTTIHDADKDDAHSTTAHAHRTHTGSSDARGLIGLLRALATVNSGPSHAALSSPPSISDGANTTTTTAPSSSTATPLVTLVQHGMLPNRVLGVAEYAALLRRVDDLHRRETTAPRAATAGGPPKKDWVLSPAQVWRHTAGYPHPLRMALCLMSFQVVVRHTLSDAMQLEDLMVIESLTRQMLRQQTRARQWQQRAHDRRRRHADDGEAGQPAEGVAKDSDGEDAPCEEDDEEALKAWCGALPALLLPARRSAAPFTATHLVHLCDTYTAIHHRLRTRAVAPSPSPLRAGRAGMAAPVDFSGTAGRLLSPSRVLMTLVPQELVAALQEAHGMATRRTVLAAGWQAALAAVLACQFDHHSPSAMSAMSTCAFESSRPRAVAPQTTALLETLAAALAERVDVLDAGLPVCVEASASASSPSTTSATATSTASSSASEAASERLMTPLLQVVPYLDPFTTARLVRGPVGRHLTWLHCLRLLPYTPLGSSSQLLLLRRVAQDREGRRAASAHLADTLHWSKEAMLSVSSAVARGAGPAPASLTAEQQALSVLLETQWSRALTAYGSVAPHAQMTAAPHVVRLLVEADVWRDVSDATLRPLVRLAIRASPGSAGAHATATATSTTTSTMTTTTTTAPRAMSAQVTVQGGTIVAHTPPSVSADGDGAAPTLTEEVLHIALRRGLWLTGLQFQQMVAEEDPAMRERTPRARQYGALLSRGLLEKSALTRAVALLLRATRRGQWEAAVQHFLDYAARDERSSPSSDEAAACPTGTASNPPSSSPSLSASSCPPNTSADSAGSRQWPFRTTLPAELAPIAQAVRYAFLQSDVHWHDALRWFPVQPSLPLPYSHAALVKARFGQLPAHAPVASGTTVQLLASLATPTASPTASPMARTASTTTPTTPPPAPAASEKSLISVARQAHKVSRPAADTRATQQTVHDALARLHQHGEWESAMLVYERATEAGVFPYQDTAIALATTLDGGAPWEVTLHYFERMTQHVRPDVATAAVALQACAVGQQWEMAFRVLRQCVLTQSRPAPYLVESAIHTALHCGIWARALLAAQTYRRTRNARLAHAVLTTYVATKQWDEAVQYFYECAVRGLRPLDASIELALIASDAASEEYRATAMMVAAIASALEDVYHVSGLVMEHVVLVHRHWHRTHQQPPSTAMASGGSGGGGRGTPLHLEASSSLRVQYSPLADHIDHPAPYAHGSTERHEPEERVYPLRFY